MDEKIDILYGNEDILNITLQTFDSTLKTIEGCIGKDEVAVHVTLEIGMACSSLSKKESNYG